MAGAVTTPESHEVTTPVDLDAARKLADDVKHLRPDSDHPQPCGCRRVCRASVLDKTDRVVELASVMADELEALRKVATAARAYRDGAPGLEHAHSMLLIEALENAGYGFEDA